MYNRLFSRGFAIAGRHLTRRVASSGPTRRNVFGRAPSYSTSSSQTSSSSGIHRVPFFQIAAGTAAVLTIATVFHIWSSPVVQLDGEAAFDGPQPKRPTTTVAQQKLPQPETSSNAISYGTKEDVQRAIAELKQALPKEGAVNTDPNVLQMYGSSDKSYHPASPHSVVVRPETTDDVVAIVDVARKYRVPIVPYSGATSLEGHFSGVSWSIGLDCIYADRVVMRY